MDLKRSLAARSAHFLVAEPAQERPAIEFHTVEEQRHVEHLQELPVFWRQWPPSWIGRASIAELALVRRAARRGASKALCSFLLLDCAWQAEASRSPG